MRDIHADKILILDFGSQYSQLIARRVREIGVYCELHPYDWPDSEIKKFNPRGIILSGGPETVTMENTPRVSALVWQLGCPILGICYGMQTMAQQLGGRVEEGNHREFGYAKLELHGHSQLFENIADQDDNKGAALLDVWMSHGDKVTQAPTGFKIIAKTTTAPIAAMADELRKFYGVQFHPEVTHTRQGNRILQRFVQDICGCDALWTSSHIIEDMLNHAREIIANEQVILGLSGGVDSAVVAALLHRAIGKQLICIFVDHGLLRLHESEQVNTTFEKHFGLKVITIDAKKRFFDALKGIVDPEQKRKIIGREFIAVFEEAAKQFPNAKWLAQGTIYPDVIESAGAKSGKAHVIKSHHNVGGLPETMALKLIEPLRELFKDEVRTIGLELGLPYGMVYRHPFPGPGLGVRILGEINQAAADLLRQADHIFLEELHKHNFYNQVSQAFAVFLPVNSVGVIGDARQYAPVIALRAVETVDFMTAKTTIFPGEFLIHVANRIVNEVRGISRVVYDITGKPPATIEWE